VIVILENDQLLISFQRPPKRVVSLVPSMTESLLDLEAGEYLVGITDYCRVPKDVEGKVVRVGGTKNPQVETVLGLEPELVIANREENSKEAVQAMEEAGQIVWLTFPRKVADVLEILWLLVRLFRIEARGSLKVKTIEGVLEWVTQAAYSRPGVRVFCPIWQAEDADVGLWWMTFNHDTYAHDLLLRCGGLNVFADRIRRYPLQADLGIAQAEDPGERDTRYPRVTPEEVRGFEPEVVLLPSEPFAFGEGDRTHIVQLLKDTPAVHLGRVCLVDGSLITWHGTRMVKALTEIPALIQSVSDGDRDDVLLGD
jgi:iron complex transport system substrate-binding protein